MGIIRSARRRDKAGGLKRVFVGASAFIRTPASSAADNLTEHLRSHSQPFCFSLVSISVHGFRMEGGVAGVPMMYVNVKVKRHGGNKSAAPCCCSGSSADIPGGLERTLRCVIKADCWKRLFIPTRLPSASRFPPRNAAAASEP